MKFIITRVSRYGSSYGEKPCEKAYMDMIEPWDILRITEEEFNKTPMCFRDGKEWREYGTQHHVLSNGNICRKREDTRQVWFLDLNTVDELLMLPTEDGQLVIKRCPYLISEDSPKLIEIHDSYLSLS